MHCSCRALYVKPSLNALLTVIHSVIVSLGYIIAMLCCYLPVSLGCSTLCFTFLLQKQSCVYYIWNLHASVLKALVSVASGYNLLLLQSCETKFT